MKTGEEILFMKTSGALHERVGILNSEGTWRQAQKSMS